MKVPGQQPSGWSGKYVHEVETLRKEPALKGLSETRQKEKKQRQKI